MNQTVLEANQIHKSFQLERSQIDVLTDINLSVKSGEFVAIMGKSGSGKSTLLSLLAGLDQPSAGHITLNGEDITNFSEEELALKRQSDIGFVFQSFHLIPTLSVRENIEFPLSIARHQDDEKVNELLSAVELEHRRDSFPHQLSGGEKQRTAIARALVANPKILFADEPTGNLDEKNANQVMQLLLNLQQAFNTALVIVTHDPELAKLADRTIHIVDGKLQ
ncbi:ABC transporter ATP-binding protein [Marinicella sp. S1101]|uniref:ABC transporter ATP-binding protein n=1 Tax=Marinicella marina TaxID=2996016 RepID=UPI002260C854|nr:ABC transporter ATP-binding protein [Marinicella marina]MCX7554830.1 ABC transporter ATP-binding protein [Marinicella marina]MDJ1140937.1 ABC transporter ATP-binding protein [Marinicella marina]